MNKLVFTLLAIAIVIAGGEARAGAVLTDENMDIITAGAATPDFNAMSMVLPGATLTGQCVGGNCVVNVNGHICTSCQLVVTQSGITVADASGCTLWQMTWPSSTFAMGKSLTVPLRL